MRWRRSTGATSPTGFTGSWRPSWYQNFFAGVDDRYILAGGVGYTFVKTDKHLLKGDIGVTGTREDPLGNAPPPELETQNFVGIAGALNYEFKVRREVEADRGSRPLREPGHHERLAGQLRHGADASLTNNLALKVSYTILYANEPPEDWCLPMRRRPPEPTGLYEFENTDTILSAALVVNF
jgi:putative salt-induced outer membrane protein YdiY